MGEGKSRLSALRSDPGAFHVKRGRSPAANRENSRPGWTQVKLTDQAMTLLSKIFVLRGGADAGHTLGRRLVYLMATGGRESGHAVVVAATVGGIKTGRCHSRQQSARGRLDRFCSFRHGARCRLFPSISDGVAVLSCRTLGRPMDAVVFRRGPCMGQKRPWADSDRYTAWNGPGKSVILDIRTRGSRAT